MLHVTHGGLVELKWALYDFDKKDMDGIGLVPSDQDIQEWFLVWGGKPPPKTPFSKMMSTKKI